MIAKRLDHSGLHPPDVSSAEPGAIPGLQEVQEAPVVVRLAPLAAVAEGHIKAGALDILRSINPLQQPPRRELLLLADAGVRWRVVVLLGAIAADIVFSGFVEFHTYEPHHYLFSSLLQLVSFAATLAAFLYVAKDVHAVRLRLPRQIVKEFRPLFLAASVDLTIILTLHVWHLTSMPRFRKRFLLPKSGYILFYVLQRLVSTLYYALLVFCARQALCEHSYNAAPE